MKTISMTGKTGYLVSNEFHGFEKFTASEAMLPRLLRSAKPSDCRSVTWVYRVEGGDIVGRVHVYNGKVQGVERM